jgi:hypothetical protein
VRTEERRRVLHVEPKVVDHGALDLVLATFRAGQHRRGDRLARRSINATSEEWNTEVPDAEGRMAHANVRRRLFDDHFGSVVPEVRSADFAAVLRPDGVQRGDGRAQARIARVREVNTAIRSEHRRAVRKRCGGAAELRGVVERQADDAAFEPPQRYGSAWEGVHSRNKVVAH